jgi:hypothetical protein
VYADKQRVFSYEYGYYLSIKDWSACSYPQCNECAITDLDVVAMDEAIGGIAFMQGYMICLLHTKLIAIHPHLYQLQIDAKGTKRFVVDGKNVVLLMADLKDGSNCCAIGNDRLVIITEHNAMIIGLSPTLGIKIIKSIECIHACMVRYDAFHKRIIIYRRVYFSIFTDDLHSIADVYPLSNDRHCVHIPPQSLYFSQNKDMDGHPGYLWGNGDCSDLIMVNDCNGKEVTHPDEKKKIIQTYYNRAAVRSALLNRTKKTESRFDDSAAFSLPRFDTLLEYIA